MRQGRAARHRKRRKLRQQQQGLSHSQADTCADLRKWMVLHSSRHDLAVTFNLVPFHFPDTGRGLKTKTAISPGSLVVSVPYCLLLTPSTVLNSHIGSLVKRWRSSFTPHQMLALFLVVERNGGTHSKWHPFIACLPTEDTLPHYFSHEELNALPPHVSLVAQRMVQRSRHAHEKVLKFCAAHWEDADRWATWDSFCWAWCSISSRSVFLEAEEAAKPFLDLDTEEENNMALCPYLDLLNHTSTARVRAGMNWQNGNYEVITDDTYQPHEQVFLGYGPHDNTTLFLHYGFTLPYNIHNKVCFSVDDFVTVQKLFKIMCWEQKLTVLRKHRLHQGLSCTMEGVSWNLMAALKILSMNWEQLQNSERVMTREALAPAIEVSARRMAQHLVREALAKTQALLAKQGFHKDMCARCAVAQSLVLDEISILTAALRDVS